MDLKKIREFKEDAIFEKEIAEKILMGDRDNYDGADGARIIKVLCHRIYELSNELEKYVQ